MSQRHATDVVALVFGTVFAGFTVVWLLAITLDVHQHNRVWWAGPLVLIVAGVTGLLVSLRPRRPGHDPAPGQQPGEPPAS